MLITKKHIMVNLEKLYPDLKFNEKYKEYFIEKIKEFFINDLNIKIKKTEKKEDIYDVLEEFSFLIERTDKSFESMYKIDDSLIEKNKNALLKSFNPEYIKDETEKELTKEEALLLINICLYIEIRIKSKYNSKFRQRNNIYILSAKEICEHFKKTGSKLSFGSYSELKDNKIIRKLFKNGQFINYDRDELFELHKKKFIRLIENNRYVLLSNLIKTYQDSRSFNEEVNDKLIYIDLLDEIININDKMVFKTKIKEENLFIDYKEFCFDNKKINIEQIDLLKKHYLSKEEDMETLKTFFKKIEFTEFKKIDFNENNYVIKID